MIKKNISTLLEDDIEKFPVWRYVENDGADVTVSPVVKRPLKNLNGKLVCCPILLANGDRVTGMLGNVDVTNERLTKHMLTLSILNQGVWFHLARYHDAEYACMGPMALADFLKLNVNDVFPIRYDIRFLFDFFSSPMVGEISLEPHEKLSRSEVIALAVP